MNILLHDSVITVCMYVCVCVCVCVRVCVHVRYSDGVTLGTVLGLHPYYYSTVQYILGFQ